MSQFKKEKPTDYSSQDESFQETQGFADEVKKSTQKSTIPFYGKFGFGSATEEHIIDPDAISSKEDTASLDNPPSSRYGVGSSN